MKLFHDLIATCLLGQGQHRGSQIDSLREEEENQINNNKKKEKQEMLRVYPSANTFSS